MGIEQQRRIQSSAPLQAWLPEQWKTGEPGSLSSSPASRTSVAPEDVYKPAEAAVSKL